MNARYVIPLLLVATSAVAPVAPADEVDSDRDHPQVFVGDSVITAKVKAHLLAQGLDDFGHIRVDTDRDGVVWLSGTARTHDAAGKAVAIARETKGVVKVNDGITVMRESD